MAGNMRGDVPDNEVVTLDQADRLSRVIPKGKYVSLIEGIGATAEYIEGARRQLAELGDNDVRPLLRPHLVRLVETGYRISDLKLVLENIDVGRAVVNILHTRCKHGDVTQPEVDEIARKCPTAQFFTISFNLGKGKIEAEAILLEKLKNYKSAIEAILWDWINKTGGPRVELEAHLINSGAYEAAKVLYKYE